MTRHPLLSRSARTQGKSPFMYLYAKLSRALRVVPNTPHTVVMVSVAIGNVQLSADLLLCTIYLYREHITCPVWLDNGTLVIKTNSELHYTHSITIYWNVLPVLCVPYLPQWCVKLMNDHFQLLTATESHDGVVASERSRLGEVRHCRASETETD